MEKYGENNDIVFATTTNGTLVHGEIQEWLYKRRNNFIVTLSLDGTPEMQNANRPFLGGQGSYERIDVDFFLRCWPNCGAKMTFSDRNADNFAEGIIYLDKLGFDPLATFASGIDWSKADVKDKLAKQMGNLTNYYIAHPQKKLCQMLNMNLELIFYPMDDDFRYCGAGLRKKCFDIQGNWYPCQGLSPLTVGKEKSEQFKSRDFKFFKLSNDNSCKKCPWIRLCRTCYAANFLETGCIERNCKDMCYINRLCMLASSKIQFERLKSRKQLTKKEQRQLKAILTIQQNVMNDPMSKE